MPKTISKSQAFLAAALLLLPAGLGAQTDPASLGKLLEPSLQSPEVTTFQLRQYLLKKVPKLPATTTAAEWTKEAGVLRENILRKVVFHGWPRELVEAPLKAEDLGEIPGGKGYRMRRIRYEIVPGLQSTAILYEPAVIKGKIPAVLNVNGHVGAPGKAVEYKQKRCINQALQGMLSLNLEWFAFGELGHPENDHYFSAHLDLEGRAGVGLFYLAMRKGLDFLYEHPNADRSRIGVTGLSGGGWQTITLSALDERVSVSAPVAGFSALVSRIERLTDVGDIEQNPPDMLLYGDYSHLTAMRAPRPTMLTYNAEDSCCFRAPLVKPYIFDEVMPFFRLYQAEDRFRWHENTDPSDHNYQLDNRLAAYRFISRHFGLPAAEAEIPVNDQIKTVEELKVGLPENNLTILGLARKLASRIERAPIPAGPAEKREWIRRERAALKQVVRYQPVSLLHAWGLNNTKHSELETRSYRLDFSNGLSAAVVWLKAIAVPDGAAPATIVLNDKGKRAAEVEVSDRLNRGERVVAADLLFTGDAAPAAGRERGVFAQMLAGAGDRPLGMEAAQLAAITAWIRNGGSEKVRIEARGMRSQVIAQVAAALEPELFSEIVASEAIGSLGYLFDTPVRYEAAPDLFCRDLYQEFDLDRLVELAAPVKITLKFPK